MRPADLTPVARDVMKLPAGPGLIFASLVGAYLFNSLPWAGWALAARPDLVLVVLVFWAVHQPGSVGQGLAFALGHKPDISRRDFIKTITAFVGAVIGAGIGRPSIFYLLSPSLEKTEDASLIDLGPLEKYPIGIPTRFEFTRTRVNGWERTATNYGLYVIRRSERDVRVFSDICTHLGCRVTWHADEGHYISPCHDGHFEIVGNVVSDPPLSPLDEFTIEVKNGNLMVSLPPIKRKG